MFNLPLAIRQAHDRQRTPALVKNSARQAELWRKALKIKVKVEVKTYRFKYKVFSVHYSTTNFT